MMERMVDRLVDRMVQNQMTQNDNGRSLPWLGNAGRLLDPRRDLNKECGYPETYSLMPDDYRNLYDRNPIASRVVDVLPRECWKVSPHIHAAEEGEDDEDFDKAWKEVVSNVFPGSRFIDEKGSRINEYWQRIDVLSGIGAFGVLFMGFDDRKRWDEPVDGVVEVPTHNVDSGNASILPTHDCFITENEEQALLNPQPRPKFKEWTTNQKTGQSEAICEDWTPPTLNNYERAILNQWKAEREFAKRVVEINRAEAVWNQAKRKGEKLPKPKILKKEEQRQTFRLWQAAGCPGTWNDVWGDSGKDSDLGTDANYASSPTMAGPSEGWSGAQKPVGISGTDQQYFGVQFGPTQQPGTKPAKKGRKLIFLRPFSEDLVQVVRYEWNVNNPRFGQPVMYRITLNDPKEMHSGVGLPMATVFVHWSRVIHVPSDANSTKMSSEIFGPPRMRPVLNRLLDLDKIMGGGAEGYWQNCFAKIFLETHPQLGGDVTVDDEAVREMMDKIENTLQRTGVLKGMSAKSLPPSVLDPASYVDVQLTAICIKLGVPKRVFMGSERGELASSQDDSDHNERIAGRQQIHCTSAIIVPFIDRLILTGVLPEPKEGFHVDWPDLDALTDLQKAQVGSTKVGAVRQYVGPTGDVATVLTEQRMYMWLGETKQDAEAICEEAAEYQEEHQQDQYDQQMATAQAQADAQALNQPSEEQGGEPGGGQPPTSPGEADEEEEKESEEESSGSDGETTKNYDQ